MNKKLTIILTLLIIFNSTLKAQTNADTNLIVKKNWGVCFTKCSNWSITSDTKNKLALIQTTGKWVGDQITIEYVLGDTIRDDSGKFGWILYSYDGKKKAWMKKFPDEAGVTPDIIKPADTLGVLADGFPIFSGTAIWRTIIIPLSRANFLRCNIIGGSVTDALYLIAGTIRKIK